LNIARGDAKKKLIDGANHSHSGAPYFCADASLWSLSKGFASCYKNLARKTQPHKLK